MNRSELVREAIQDLNYSGTVQIWCSGSDSHFTGRIAYVSDKYLKLSYGNEKQILIFLDSIYAIGTVEE